MVNPVMTCGMGRLFLEYGAHIRMGYLHNSCAYWKGALLTKKTFKGGMLIRKLRGAQNSIGRRVL